MTSKRFAEITDHYSRLKIAVVGDFCLDRYLEIDPAREETSIETGLPVYNVTHVRSQPGGAGTIVNNLSALGICEIFPIGFCGDDGEGFELKKSLGDLPGVAMKHFIPTSQRRTFTYCKPLIVRSHAAPVELNRLDSKNWSPTPKHLENVLIKHLHAVADVVDVVIVLDQVDEHGTGVVTRRVLGTIQGLSLGQRRPFFIGDSRHGFTNYPAIARKMNEAEARKLLRLNDKTSRDELLESAAYLAHEIDWPVFITLAENGILAVSAEGNSCHRPAAPVTGAIDIVGAGDAVTANLATAIASGATLDESIQIANSAASVVIHKLGTTGTAHVAEIGERIGLIQ